MRRSMAAAAAVLSLTVAGTARAQGAGYHEHDGFYLNLDLGVGSLGSKASAGGQSLELSGTAAQFSLAAGGVVAPNLIVAGQVWGAGVDSPKVKMNGQSASYTGSLKQQLNAVGLNLTYYFMPLNVYVAVTPSIGTLTLTANGKDYATKNGFAFRLAAGKEWWVSQDWGLGLNLQYAHSSNEDKGTNAPTYDSNWFGVAFSATYN